MQAASTENLNHFFRTYVWQNVYLCHFPPQLLQLVSKCESPLHVRCLRPNGDRTPMRFDMPVVLEQIRHAGMVETIRIRKHGYPVKMKYSQFAQRYRCLLYGQVPRGAPTKEVCRVILDREDRAR